LICPRKFFFELSINKNSKSWESCNIKLLTYFLIFHSINGKKFYFWKLFWVGGIDRFYHLAWTTLYHVKVYNACFHSISCWEELFQVMQLLNLLHVNMYILINRFLLILRLSKQRLLLLSKLRLLLLSKQRLLLSE